ncbi:MAG: DUF4129 domain-containing protein [Clostridia bacterium]|nr:DUF4129 domain-containing protein [Clostridia bacterium]
MNRFFRTAYATTLVCLCLTLLAVLITGVAMPFLSFSCLYFGLLLALLPAAIRKLSGKETLFALLGVLTALVGFVPLIVLHCPLLHYPVHLAGIVLAAVFCSVLRHRTTHADFKAKYQFTVVVVLTVIGFVYLALLAGMDRSGTVPVQSENVRTAVNGIVPHAVVLLVTGVLHLRGLRAQEGVVDERAFNRRQLRDTLIFAVLVTVVFLVDPFAYLKEAFFFVINDVLKPAAGFIARMLGALLKLISCVKPHMQEEPLPTPEPTAGPEQLPVTEPVEVEPEHYYVEGDDLSLTLSYIFIGAAALILLLILGLQIRKLVKKLRKRNQNRGRGYPNETREAIAPEAETDTEEKPRKHSEDPRERIRYLYAEFLKYLRKIPIRFAKTHTCGEIGQRAKRGLRVDPADVTDLTELYEQARYRQKEAPGDADARRMKALLSKIKNRT